MVKLTGACVFCKLSSATLEGIQSKMVERLGELVRIIPVAWSCEQRGIERGIPCGRSISTTMRRRARIPLVVAAMLPFFSDQFGNASSAHAFGSRGRGRGEAGAQEPAGAARRRVRPRDRLHLRRHRSPTTRPFCRRSTTQDGRDEIVTTAVEHPAILSLAGTPREVARDKGAPDRRRCAGPAGYRSLSARARAAHGDRLGDVGEQRDRNAVSGRATRRNGAWRRRAVPHRCGAGGRQDSARSEVDRNRHAVAVGTQAARAQGHRRALSAQGHASSARWFAAVRRSGGGAAAPRMCRALSDWERRPNWRWRIWRTSGRASAPCATVWSTASFSSRPLLRAGRRPRTGCRTPPISPSNISKAKPSFII